MHPAVVPVAPDTNMAIAAVGESAPPLVPQEAELVGLAPLALAVVGLGVTTCGLWGSLRGGLGASLGASLVHGALH